MVIALEHNYRSTQPSLDAANAVMDRASEGFAKTLTSSKPSAELPYLITVEDESAQAVFIAGQVLEQCEAGIALRHQAGIVPCSTSPRSAGDRVGSPQISRSSNMAVPNS